MSTQHDHDHSHDHEHDIIITMVSIPMTMDRARHMPMRPGMSQARMVQIEEDILGKNNEYAAANRRWFGEHGILALNLVSSPGSGKTTLLTRTIDDLKTELKLSVIEGDQQTANDAERIRETGVKALQINTGKGLPSGWPHGRPCAGEPEAGRRQRAVHRERGQPGLPGGLRSGRGAQGGDPVGDRGRGQAHQVPGHVSCRRPDVAEQDRSAALPAVRCGQVHRICAPGESGHQGVAGFRHQWRGMDSWYQWIKG